MSRTDHHRPRRIRALDFTGGDDGFIYWSPTFGWSTKWPSRTGVPRWYTTAVWHSPERRRERDGLRAMAQQYNAGHLTDEDFPNHQARHMAAWTYW